MATAGPMAGWLASGVPTYRGSKTLPITVWPQDGLRPLVEIATPQGEVPRRLYVEQQSGISPQRMIEIVSACAPCGEA